MPRIDWAAYEAAEETTGGGVEQMMPGAYILRIQAVRTQGKTKEGPWTSAEKQYALLVYDVAEGPFAGKYSDAYFCDWNKQPDPDKDFMHCHYLSWKKIGYLKKQLRCITESNPGFDAAAAFDADQWGMFVGKVFGAVIDGEVDLNDRGYDRWKLKIGDIITVQDVRDGNHREPKVTDNRKPRAAAAATDPYGDIPL